jgi:hypothetical protein
MMTIFGDDITLFILILTVSVTAWAFFWSFIEVTRKKAEEKNATKRRHTD